MDLFITGDLVALVWLVNLFKFGLVRDI
uniref:Uncharacterized protein n=1 Tax=Tetranychus urticae TaxID=32264 RepID=T1KUM7_TETUR